MISILFAKTFFLVGLMLVITTICTRINKEYETTLEAILTFLGTFVFLFALLGFSDIFPLNIFLVSCFAAVMGWSLGPTITFIGKRFKFKRFLKKRGIQFKKDPKDPKNKAKQICYKEDKAGKMHILEDTEIKALTTEFESEIARGGDPYNKEWQNIIFQAMLGTTIAVFATGSLVFMSDLDFSFLGIFLFIALLILIAMTLLNTFVFKSRFFSLLKAYFGVILFTLYLLYDFDRLESLGAQGETSWSAAIHIAVNLYLDIINLFLYLLEIFAD